MQLIKVLDRWTEAIDIGTAVDIVYCDFVKAFDKAPHKSLMEKLAAYGIGQKYLNWVKAFLENRQQRVVINGETSAWEDVISGVPQGSVLGPVLFVLFINDLPSCLEHDSEIYMYADDTKIYRQVRDQRDCEMLQEDLDRMNEWTEKWLLKFHPEKCRYMRIGSTNVEDNGYHIGLRLDKCSEEKDLGVVLDDRLSFSEHLSEKINKANKIVGIIRRTFEYLDTDIFRALYVAFVRPHIEYANQVWCPYEVRDIEAIENVQRRATKLVPQIKGLPYEERLKTLKLPSLAYRRSRGDLIETFKIVNEVYDRDCSDGVFSLRRDSVTRGN